MRCVFEKPNCIKMRRLRPGPLR